MQGCFSVGASGIIRDGHLQVYFKAGASWVISGWAFAGLLRVRISQVCFDASLCRAVSVSDYFIENFIESFFCVQNLLKPSTYQLKFK